MLYNRFKKCSKHPLEVINICRFDQNQTEQTHLHIPAYPHQRPHMPSVYAAFVLYC